MSTVTVFVASMIRLKLPQETKLSHIVQTLSLPFTECVHLTLLINVINMQIACMNDLDLYLRSAY
jgi:hypothetical protein